MLATATLAGCSYNPLVQTNQTTGSAEYTAFGAAAGAGIVSTLKGATKTSIAFAGLGGGLAGYYMSTLRYDAGGIMYDGGQVYKVGDYVGIYIPTRKIFYPNTAEFTPHATNVLDSLASVLMRYPNNNIMISGNTSGYDRPKRELMLSLKRARAVSAYLWNKGITDTDSKFEETKPRRKLNYVGYGDYFPVASNRSLKGIMENSRIQVTSYPTTESLNVTTKTYAFGNVGALNNEIKVSTDNGEPKIPKTGCAKSDDRDMKGCFEDA